MPYDECELSEGMTYEVLPENEFMRQLPSYTNGTIRLHPYNEVIFKYD